MGPLLQNFKIKRISVTPGPGFYVKSTIIVDPYLIPSLNGVTIRQDLTFTTDSFFTVSVNSDVTRYISLYMATTSGSIKDDTKVFYGAYDYDEKIEASFVKLQINSLEYYLPTYTGLTHASTCAKINGVEDSVSTFTTAGFVLLNINNVDAKYVEVFTKT